MLDLLSALEARDGRPAARALRELLAGFDRALAEPLRHWEAEQAAISSERRASA